MVYWIAIGVIFFLYPMMRWLSSKFTCGVRKGKQFDAMMLAVLAGSLCLAVRVCTTDGFAQRLLCWQRVGIRDRQTALNFVERVCSELPVGFDL